MTFRSYPCGGSCRAAAIAGPALFEFGAQRHDGCGLVGVRPVGDHAMREEHGD